MFAGWFEWSLVLAVVLSLLFLLGMQKPFFFLFYPSFAQNP